MRVKTTPSFTKQKFGLHLLLVATIFLYLYSPLLDHWLGVESYARPHTHINAATSYLSTLPEHAKTHSGANSEAHEEGVFCFLDINALLSMALSINTSPVWFLDFAHHASLVFDLLPSYFLFPSVYLSSLDPPPRF